MLVVSIAVGLIVVPGAVSRDSSFAVDQLRFCNVIADVYCDAAADALARGDNEAAKKTAISALAMTPENVRARYMLGVAFFRLSDRDGARREWVRCLANDPGYKPALRALKQLGRGFGD